MKSEKSVPRLAASAPADWTSGLDDNSRFANVVMPHIDDAYRLARWLTGNSTDAEDVVQDASLRAFRAIRGFAGGSARAWVLSIVRNTAFTWLKKHRDPRLVAVENIELVEAPGPEQDGGPFAGPSSPEASLIERADAARLEAAIGALPEEFRETLVLRDMQGLDYRAIAEVTGVPIGTVMSRLARARRRLMAQLGKDTE
jgi:RNA polymerase sigma-70 factor (ECF subfamily)